jgi:hypothetical protein
MLVTRRKPKEDKDIMLYLHSKPLEQVCQMKYLGVILDQKFRFPKHIKYTTERCTKLTHNLSRVARLTWGLRHGNRHNIQRSYITPTLIWFPGMD